MAPVNRRCKEIISGVQAFSGALSRPAANALRRGDTRRDRCGGGQEFLASGYATTSMDTIAKCAGVSKKTLYRLIPNKAELLRFFIAGRIERFMLAIDDSALRDLDAPRR